jgi:hypothetical protein
VIHETNGIPTVAIDGCGSVTFRADDCLASHRRAYRRQRRNIRATRTRIERIKRLLTHLGVLTREELDKPGCAWPWKLSAQVIQGGEKLSWGELWDVLRWYAHNRGYDGNLRWSRGGEQDGEDAEKVVAAHALMLEHDTATMAETVCAVCKVEPLGKKKSSNIDPKERFTHQNAAFPREVVVGEVRRVLEAHEGKLPKVDAKLIRVLLGDSPTDDEAWKTVDVPDIRLPKRYVGGLLFGQLVPRFDNRIISICPVSGGKVPSRKCPEFLNYRWAMQLANIRVKDDARASSRPLTLEERAIIDEVMRDKGYLTASGLKKAVRDETGCASDNLDNMLMHPDAKEALVLNPVQRFVSGTKLKDIWPLLPEQVQKRNQGRLRRGKTITVGNLLAEAGEAGADPKDFEEAIDKLVAAAKPRGKKAKNKPVPTREEVLAAPLQSPKIDGRAAYARHILEQATDEVMTGKDPRETGGCLYVTDEMRQQQMTKPIEAQTNNHMIRHRLLILERLLKDIIKDYADGNGERVAAIAIEVNRDLREFSGKTAKEIQQDLGLRISNHHKIAAKLEKELEGSGTPITASLIRKARVAEDLGWKCPYTGQSYDVHDLTSRKVDRDHVVPRSQRSSDSLDSLVITFSEVNRMKGNRTALQFIEEEGGSPVEGRPQLSVLPAVTYKKAVEKLESFKGHNDDKQRKKRRKEMLLVRRYEEKDFTPGDLTQTSQLVRLGAQVLARPFQGCSHKPKVTSLPGQVTGAVRKAWRLLGTMSKASPDILNEEGEVKTKKEIRGITHMHHALDASVLALTTHFIPNNGRVWELISKRRLKPDEAKQLRLLGIFDFNEEGQFRMRDLDGAIKEQLTERLAERRVVQHLPSSMDGLRVEKNTRGIVESKDGRVKLIQRSRDEKTQKRIIKDTEEVSGKVLGLDKGKLKDNKGARVINANYGMALEPEPTIIPFHKVWPRLQDLKASNGGKMPRVLRNGQLIHVPRGRYEGTWRIFSVKASMTLDMARADKVKMESKGGGQKREVRISTLLNDGLEILPVSLCGCSV